MRPKRKTNINQALKLTTGLALGVSLVPAYTNAADIEEVLVTASRREERLQDVPMSISALSGEILSNVGAKELADYFTLVPSTNISHNSIGERGGQNIIMRGIANSRTTITGDASLLSATTGFYVNDIPMVPVDTQLFDVERIEVLRGPQGTLYGAGSLGGAIKLYHRRTNLNEYEAAVEGTASTVAKGGLGMDVSGMLNIPILDGVLGARIVGSYRERDGFIDSVIIPLSNVEPNTTYPFTPNQHINPSDSASQRIARDSNSADSKGVRVAVLYQPTERLTVEGAFLWQSTGIDDLSLYNKAMGNTRIQEKFLLEPNSSEVTLSSLDVAYDFGPVTLSSITSTFDRNYDETIDYSYVVKGIAAPALTYMPARATLETLADWTTYTQEIRLQSNRGASTGSLLSRFDWVLGAFWLDETRTNWSSSGAPGWSAAAPNNPLRLPNDFNGAGYSVVKDKNEAYFVDLTFHLTDAWTIGAGIRYFELSSHWVGGTLPGPASDRLTPVPSDRKYEEDGHSPKFFTQYKWNEDLMIYGSYAEGFRLGGSTNQIDYNINPQCQPVVEQNNLQKYAGGQYFSDSVATTEVGLKSGVGPVSINVSAYRTEWDDMQQQILLSGYPGSLCTLIVTANVGSAQVDGYELEVTALATERFSVALTGSYTDARITDPGGAGSVNRKGDRFDNVPEWSGSLVANYSVPTEAFGGSEFFLRGDLRYVGDRYRRDPAGLMPTLPEYTLLGLRGGFTFGAKPTTVTVFVNNVTNEDVALNARARIGVASNIVVTPGMPRTIGLTVHKEW